MVLKLVVFYWPQGSLSIYKLGLADLSIMGNDGFSS
jgi:hypothetical protein